MSRRVFWMIAIGYSAVVFVLHNVLETTIGAFLMQISSFALFFGIFWFLYRIIKFSIQQFMYNRK
ncbi:hypothetical protein [Desemzia sp. FAM 23991]|uniref:hypothetical protein n=1 Tax=unclassified Desemzia TaxID=2685243 RepID=UPI0038892183